MIAQGPWKAWPRRLDTIVADGHPAPDLKYFAVHHLPYPSGGHLEMFAVCFLSPMPSISECGHML